MDMTSFVSNDPAVRADGWSPERKLRFLNRLAICGNVRAACAAVGMSRDAAYTLRRRDALFARGWAAALLLAREGSVELLADKATEGIEEDVWYRGELRGTRRRFDARLLLAHIARLDRMAEEADDGAEADAARFDTILAAIAGTDVPEELRDDVDPLPIPRACAVEDAEHEARARVNATWAEREAASEDGTLDEEAYAAYLSELEAAVASASAEATAQWDGWFENACSTVDDLIGHDAAESPAGPPSDPPPASPAAAGETGAPEAADSSSRTVSDVSGSGGGATASEPAADAPERSPPLLAWIMSEESPSLVPGTAAWHAAMRAEAAARSSGA